jgi:CheY-like chemotaxis protein
VLVAHPEVEEAKAIGEALTSWGLDVHLAHDGVEAILGIQRSLPRLVVLDAALPKMFGFQVCELVKRNESLREIAVVLVGAIHHEDRYRRPPGELYGADAYLERQQIPEGLVPLLRELGLDRRRGGDPVADPGPVTPAAPTPEVSAVPPQAAAPPAPEVSASAPPVVRAAPAAKPPARVATQAPAPVSKPPARVPTQAPPPASKPPARVPTQAPAPAAPPSAEIATAERLARIIVSDIVLYNAERFERAVSQGEVVAAMAAELAEGRGLLSQRVGSTVDVAGLLESELLRVARARGMD